MSDEPAGIIGHYRKRSIDEENALEAWRSGDISLFDSLVRMHLPRLYNLAFRITGSHRDAGAVVQDACVAGFRGAECLSAGNASCFELLAGIVVTHCRERILALPPMAGGDSPPSGDGTERHGQVQAFGQGEQARSTLHDRLQECIGMLPVELREAVVLRDVQRASYEEMAAILRITPETAMVRAGRAREMTRDCLKQSGRGMEVHGDIRRRFSAYLENSLTVGDKEEIKRHLGACGLCREELANLEWALGLLGGLPIVEVPPLLAATIRENLQLSPVAPSRQPVSRRPPVIPLRIGLVAGAAAVAAIFALLSFRTGTTESPPHEVAAPPSKGSGTAERITPAPLPADMEPLPRQVPQSLPRPPLRNHEGTSRSSSLQAVGLPLPGRTVEEPQLRGAEEESESDHETVELSVREKRLPSVAPQREKRGQEQGRQPGELDIALIVDDPAVAAEAIERAVSRSGGRITGRAYSSGSDFCYAQIDSRNFADLVSRLGRIGKITERPLLSEGVSGQFDLIIRW